MEEYSPRKLVVILHADVVGSTALVQRNESVAHERMQDVFRRFSVTIESYGGIAHEIRGDALVAEFARASDAVTAALAFQFANEDHNKGVTDDIRPEIRIGISLSEVVIADGTITGAGVVLAQRLEQLAEPGGVCIQGAAYETVPRRLPFKYESLGEQEVKGFEEPVRVYTATLKPGEAIPQPESVARPEEPTLQLPDKPSIAVLPFENMSGDPEQAYFADGMAEELITALSRFRWFFVIARNSSFTYKGRAVDVRQVGQELGVRYVLEGSVRKAGNRIRVTAQLIDARTGNHIWAERYDRELTDIFALQDEITESIVATVHPELRAIEREHARRKPPENLDAWGLYQRGLWYLYGDRSRDSLAEARRLFQRTCKLDPEFATVYAELAWTHTIDITRGFADSREASLSQATIAAEKAVALDARDPVAHFALGRVLMLRHEFEEAIAEMEAALSLNSNFGRAYYGLGMALLYGGKPEESIPQFEQAIRLNPRSPLLWHYFYTLACAYFNMGRDEEALTRLDKANQQLKSSYWSFAVAAAALGHLNRIDEARKMLAEVRKRKADFSANSITSTIGPYGPHSGADRIIEGLRKAGLQE